MAELNPPWALQNLATHTAAVNREAMNAIFGGGEGVLSDSGLGTMSVTQRGAGANMSVDVAAGICMVFGDENNVQGLYGCVNDAVVNKAIAAADPTNPRRDLVCVRVRDSFYSGAVNAWDLFVVTGTPAASPADPAVPQNAVTLARVAVATSASSITNANITDLRPYASLGVIPGNSARRPGVLYGAFSQEPAFKTLPVSGQMFYEQDTNLLYVYNGTAWVCITPQTAQVATAQAIGSTGSYVDLATSGPAVTVQTGTRALVTLSSGYNSTVAPNVYIGVAVSGATTLAASDANALGPINIPATNNGASSRHLVISGLTAGANTFTMKYKTTAITVTTFLNRDITVVGLP